MDQHVVDSWLYTTDEVKRRDPGLGGWFKDRAALLAVAELLEWQDFEPGATLVTQGDRDREAWLVTDGAVEFIRRETADHTATIREAKAPSAFGAFGFAIGTPRSATVRATTATTAARLTRQRLAEISDKRPDVAIGLVRWLALDIIGWLQRTRSGTDTWSRVNATESKERRFAKSFPARRPLVADSTEFNDALLKIGQVRCFQPATLNPLTTGLGEHLGLVEVSAGDAIVSDGDDDPPVLILLNGDASVLSDGGRVLGRFTGGAASSEDVVIGELGFLAGTSRDGTVTATSTCTLLEVPISAMPWLASEHPTIAFQLHVALLRTVCGRLEEADDERKRTLAIRAGDFDAWFES